MTTRYLVHPDSLLEWVTGVRIYSLLPKQYPKLPARGQPKPDSKPVESNKGEPNSSAHPKLEKGNKRLKGINQERAIPEKENRSRPEPKSEVAAEPRFRSRRAHCFVLDFAEIEYDSSTSTLSSGGRTRTTHIEVERGVNKEFKKATEFIAEKAPKLKSCLKQTKLDAEEDEDPEVGKQYRCVKSITQENTRGNRGFLSDGQEAHVSKAKVNLGIYHNPPISSVNHRNRQSQALNPPKNISTSQPQAQDPSRKQSDCNCHQRQVLSHLPSQIQSPGPNPRLNQHQRGPPSVIQQQTSQSNIASNSSNFDHPRTQSVQQPRAQRSPTMQAPQLQIIQPIRAEVIMREDVIESPMDPRPNAFFCAKTGVLRVYHGAQYGNPYATILPHPPMSIGTYPPHAGQFMGHPRAVPGNSPALVPGGPPSMHAPLPSPAPQHHHRQQVNSPTSCNQNFNGENNFQYGGPEGGDVCRPPVQSLKDNGWQTLTVEQAENMPFGNMPGSFPMDAPGNDQQHSFNQNAGGSGPNNSSKNNISGGGGGFNGSSNRNTSNVSSGWDWNNSNPSEQPSNNISNNHSGGDSLWGNNDSSNNNNTSRGGDWSNSNNKNNNSGGESWNNQPSNNNPGGDSFANKDSFGNNSGGGEWKNNSSNDGNNNSGGGSWGGDNNQHNSCSGNNFDPQNSKSNSGGCKWNGNNSNQQQDSKDNPSDGWNNNITSPNTNEKLGRSGWNDNNNIRTLNEQSNNNDSNPGGSACNGSNNYQSSKNQFNNAKNNFRGNDLNDNKTQNPNNQYNSPHNDFGSRSLNDNKNSNYYSNNKSSGNDWDAPAIPAPWGDMSAAQSGDSPNSLPKNNNFSHSSVGSGWNNNTSIPNWHNNNPSGGNNWGNETVLSAGSWGGDATGPTGGGGSDGVKQNGW